MSQPWKGSQLADPMVRLPADIGFTGLFILFEHLDTEASVPSANRDELKSLRQTVEEWLLLFRQNAEDYKVATTYSAGSSSGLTRTAQALQGVWSAYQNSVAADPKNSMLQRVIAAGRAAQTNGTSVLEAIQHAVHAMNKPLDRSELFLLLLDIEQQSEEPIRSAFVEKIAGRVIYDLFLLIELVEFIALEQVKGDERADD